MSDDVQKLHRVYVTLPCEVIDYIEAEAKRTGNSKSNLCRRMILKWLDANSEMEFDESCCEWGVVK